MKKFVALLLVFCVMLSSVSAYADYKIPFSGVVDNLKFKELVKNASRKEDSGILYPPAEHPYLFVNEEYINTLKENKDDDVYKTAYSYQLSLAKKNLPAQPEGGILSENISSQLCARAFMYVMGEVDKNHAKETVNYAITYLKNAQSKQTYSISKYKDFGENAIQCGAFVYDWCYDAMTEGQRVELAEVIRTRIYSPEQPCRPDNIASAWSDLNGKAVGMPILYNCVGVSAVYDQYPDMYELVMNKVQGTMAQAAKIYSEAGALTDGSIAYSREDYTYTVELLFSRMGYDTTDLYGKSLSTGYFLLYGRLPYGAYLKYGDNSPTYRYVFGEYLNSVDVSENMGLLNVKYEDPYLKHYYERSNVDDKDLITLLCKKGYHDAETPDELPLAYETFSPRSSIVAKTSWQEGIDSPQVTAFLNMNNRRSGDHDHADHGSFQLYYKGPLSIPGGIYHGEDWGLSHWRNYYTRTISKNAMLIYDPDEIYVYGRRAAEANDGGQLGAGAKDGGYVIEDVAEHMADDNVKTDTIGTYIGPNEKTPAFSYVKGDLTDAYSKNKMDNFQRSMVFMDTFNETYPGVLVVFDHIVSTRASFKKTFLLQAVAEPHVDGNKVTIINSESNPLANGKLVNTTLIPEEVTIGTVGGLKIYESGGEVWPVISEDSKTSNVQDATDPLYQSGWRAEISPAAANKEDIFLNAMFVADADTTAPDLEMKKLEDGDMVGVAVLDRQVMFKKDGKTIEDQFTLNVADNNGGKEMLVLVTDVKVGKWKVRGESVNYVIECKDYDNAFVFSAKPGKYTISPADEEDEVTTFDWPEAKKEKIGDISVKVGTSYQYLRQPTKLVNGVPYLPESFITYSTKCDYVRDGNVVTITVSDGTVITLTAGQNSYKRTRAGSTVTMPLENPPFIDENGVFYFNTDNSVGTSMGYTCTYIPSAKSLNMLERVLVAPGESSSESTSGGGIGTLVGVDESKVVWPVMVFCSSDDGNIPSNLIDRNLETRWSSVKGDGEWACFEMGEEPVEMTDVQIAFYNGDKRNWKFDIQISNDGINFTTILENMKSAGKSKDVETFKLPEGTKARFIRYVGHGEEVTDTLYNSVTQFIVVNNK